MSFPDLPAGPPLGLGGLPFESMEFELPVGSLLALFTDGLVEARDHDIGHGLDTLGRVLADRSASLEELCDRAVSELVPGGTSADDTALLLVRTRELDAERVADWELRAEPVSVGRARELATGQLEAWGLEELVFATQLVVSELVTNAVRYAGGPLGLRLIRDRTLVCEVADTGHTSPTCGTARRTTRAGAACSSSRSSSSGGAPGTRRPGRPSGPSRPCRRPTKADPSPYGPIGGSGAPVMSVTLLAAGLVGAGLLVHRRAGRRTEGAL